MKHTQHAADAATLTGGSLSLVAQAGTTQVYVGLNREDFGSDKSDKAGGVIKAEDAVLFAETILKAANDQTGAAFAVVDMGAPASTAGVKPGSEPLMRPQDIVVLRMLQAKGNSGVSQVEASAVSKVRSLTKRIATLRANGHTIETQWKRDTGGQRYARYVLKEAA